MSIECDRAGTFRGKIFEYGLYEAQSGAVAVTIKAKLTEFYDAENSAWVPWEEYDMEVEGNVWVIKKNNGGVNEAAAKSLVECTGWDGKFSSVRDGSWHPSPCQFSVTHQPYEGVDYYKVNYVNDFDRTPGGGGLGNVDESKAKAIDSQYGASMRALFSGTKRNATKPATNAPKSPPKKPAPVTSNGDQTDDGGIHVPF
jgi:hypothetical protein